MDAPGAGGGANTLDTAGVKTLDVRAPVAGALNTPEVPKDPGTGALNTLLDREREDVCSSADGCGSCAGPWDWGFGDGCLATPGVMGILNILS